MSIETDRRIVSRLCDEPASTVKRLLRRANMQLEFARELKAALPADKTNGWDGLLADADEILEQFDPGTGSMGLTAAVDQIEQALAPIGQVAKTYRIHCIGHGHIDMNWMWSWQETVSTTHDTFASVLELMDEYPEFTYSQSQASVYALVEKYHPWMFEQIRQRAREGRWEVTAAQWVEGDKNLASGESIARHLLYTRRYFTEKFGLSATDVPVDWEPDTFGHAATIPTILSQGAVKYYYSCRQGGGFGHPIVGDPRPALYYWEGPDGSRIMVNRELTWYIGYIGMTENVALPMARFARENGLHEWMMVYGVGNHGGGPTRAELENFIEQMTWPVYPRLVFSTSRKYFEALDAELAEPGVSALPVLKGELNFEFTGCYTSQSLIKQANRWGENYLEETEALAAIAARVAGADYPRDLLRDAWINVLFNQFHDILPGSGVRETREYAMALFQETGAITGAIKKNATTALIRLIDTASLLPDTFKGRQERKLLEQGKANRLYEAGTGHGAGSTGLSAAGTGGRDFRPLIVFNPSPFPVTGRVTGFVYDTPWAPGRVVALDDQGHAAPVDPVSHNSGWGGFHGAIQLEFDAVDVPAYGYRTYLITEDEAPGTEPQAWAGNGVIETPHLSIAFDRLRSGLLKLVDRRTGVDLAAGPFGQWQLVTEKSRGMTSWTVGYEVDLPVPLRAKGFRIMNGLADVGDIGEGFSAVVESRKSAMGFRVIWDLAVPGTTSTVKVTASVNGREPRIDFTAEIDWREIGDGEKGIPGLAISFPTALASVKSRFEAPFGSVERSLTHGEEVPALRWANLSGTATTADGRQVPASMTLLQDCKYGHSVAGSELRLRIVRSSFDPDPTPEIARTTVRYSVYLHDTEPDPAALTRLGQSFNHPLIVAPARLQEGTAPTSRGFANSLTPNVALTALKQPEDGDGLIVRLAELNGQATEAIVELSNEVAAGLSNVCQVDLLEQAIDGVVKWDSSRLRVPIEAYGLVTVRLT
jgi:alpha-mannosidase